MAGGSVCATHGGRAPQVRRRAAQRLLEASDTAAAYLVSVIQDDKLPAETRLKASLSLLDRAGLGSKQAIEVEVVPAEKPLWERLLPKILYVVDEDEAATAAQPGRPELENTGAIVPPSDSQAARATYLASRTAGDPMPPARDVQRVDGPRARERRRRT